MAQIADGQQYALRSQHQSKAGKGCSIVLVKLTDSMIKSIEDYVSAVQKVSFRFPKLSLFCVSVFVFFSFVIEKDCLCVYFFFVFCLKESNER